METEPCWKSVNISRLNAYRMYNAFVLLTLGPFTFFNIQKSKFLQIFTSTYRISAFILMIILTTIALIRGERGRHIAPANVDNIPQFFGVAVLSCVCQQALPSIIVPIRNKKYLFRYGFATFSSILLFYLLICFTAIFAFRHLSDVYTSTFSGRSCGVRVDTKFPQVALFQILIPLYPVFTLSANFTINLVTLNNNLNTLFAWSSYSSQSSQFIRKVFVPLIALIPPVVIALSTSNFVLLAGIVGNYTGISMQLLIPSILLLSARKRLNTICENDEYSRQQLNARNKYKLSFTFNVLVYFVLIWSILCLVLVTIKIII
ncbi:transmembrane protein 104-like protein [Leptotrombidium deliense]|uniref:Transmembrane protein 104-like protein n=1 Tax=Leptotrombidium deliense TaxID=299467 RepID=A0A443STE3_9ACAR|nr:transmembrane protein 104-like protein [Leptotrombidium deliense]